MEVLILAALIGLIPAMIAQSKGRSFALWWFYGAMLFIIALPHSIIMSADKKSVEEKQLSEGMKKCPYCAEMIKEEAKVCRYCGRELTEETPSAMDKPSASTEKNNIQPEGHIIRPKKDSEFTYKPSHADEN